MLNTSRQKDPLRNMSNMNLLKSELVCSKLLEMQSLPDIFSHALRPRHNIGQCVAFLPIYNTRRKMINSSSIHFRLMGRVHEGLNIKMQEKR
eukprot:3218948-Amphidinium_carterae.1